MSTETQLKLELPSHQRAAQLWTRTGKSDPGTHKCTIWIGLTNQDSINEWFPKLHFLNNRENLRNFTINMHSGYAQLSQHTHARTRMHTHAPIRVSIWKGFSSLALFNKEDSHAALALAKQRENLLSQLNCNTHECLFQFMHIFCLFT